MIVNIKKPSDVQSHRIINPWEPPLLPKIKRKEMRTPLLILPYSII